MERTWRLPLAWVLLFAGLVPSRAVAYEPIKEKTTGASILCEGYEEINGGVLNSTSWPMTINTRERNGAAWQDMPVNSAMELEFWRITFAARQLWQNVPSARFRSHLAGWRSLDVEFQDDTFNMMTVSTTGSAALERLRTVRGVPLIREFDLKVQRVLVTNVLNALTDAARLTQRATAVATATQEFGHGIGFEHSLVADEIVRDITGATSDGAYMAYGEFLRPSVLAAANLLAPDDIALISDLYPRHTNRIALTTGTIRGTTLTADGSRDLFGANVLAVRRADGQAVTGRISGFQRWKPDLEQVGPKNGDFTLTGLPAGAYDVYIRPYGTGSRVNPQIQLANLRGDILAVEGQFDVGFARGVVRNITVRAGEVVDVGYVLAGEDRAFTAPSRTDTAIKWSAGSPTGWYWVDIFHNGARYSSGWITGNSYLARRIPAAVVTVGVWAWTGSTWQGVVGWHTRDFRCARLSVTWTRQVYTLEGQTVEYWYYIDLAHVDSPTHVRDLVPVDNSRFTMMVPSGSWFHRVWIRQNQSQLPWVSQSWTSTYVQ